jgi:hypothetical protein
VNRALDLRSPYSAAEWSAIAAGLKAERERRQKLGRPFPQEDQSALAREVVRPLRAAVQGSLALQEAR